ncbi:MAG: hypothetical protein OXH50_05405, partial [Gemmatimonadetes bacterium]|nr:hypothetical protein [Gemmatimonadota bacterium]
HCGQHHDKGKGSKHHGTFDLKCRVQPLHGQYPSQDAYGKSNSFLHSATLTIRPPHTRHHQRASHRKGSMPDLRLNAEN